MIGERARGGLLHDPAVPGKGWEGCHDLTGGRALVCIAGELREREAARAARAARRRGSWLFRIVRRVRDWRARWERGAEGQVTGAACPSCGAAWVTPPPPGGLCPACVDRERLRTVLAERLEDLGPGGLLAVARAAALRDHQPELADAIHTVLLLDMTGRLGEMAPLVADVRAGFEAALGDLPRVDIN